jgi:hypothetical protein
MSPPEGRCKLIFVGVFALMQIPGLCHRGQQVANNLLLFLFVNTIYYNQKGAKVLNVQLSQ